MKNLILNNGLEIPSLGLGANGIWGKEEVRTSEMACKQYDIYCYALQSGKCRLFDTSGSYGWNENILGDAITDTKCRENVLIMTKIGNRAQREQSVRKALESSLKKMRTDYVDIYLIHWPQTGTFVNTYKEMVKLYEEGLIKAIGVCNFQRHHLEELRANTDAMPMLNEIEIHPLFTQDTLCNYCYAHDINVIAYSPVGRMHDVLIKARPIRDLASRYEKTPVQIILRWHYQLGHIAIPQTLNKGHFDEIFDIDSFQMTSKEIALISSLNDNIRLRYNPDTCDFSALG